MKNKTIIFIFSLIAMVCICFTTCDMTNPIIEKWWEEKEPETEPKTEEPEYIALLKYLPVNYDTIIEEKIVYETIFVQLPPEVVYETQYETKYIYETIYEQLPPEVIYEVVEVVREKTEYVTVYQDVIEYIQTPPDRDTIIEWLQNPANEADTKEIINIIKELYPDEFTDYIYEYIPGETIYEMIEVIKTVPEYITVYQEIETYITTPPDKESIIEWLTDPANEADTKEVINIIKELYPDEFIDYIYVELPPEIIYQQVEVIKEVPEYITVYQDVIEYIQTPPDKESIIEWLKDPANETDVEEIIRIIKEMIPKDVIKEIIKEIPPKDIIEYLTDEQIAYIVSQQPAKMILQSIRIIGIEYVIFAGDSFTVNGPPVAPATTQLTAQEKAYNTSTIENMADLLKKNPTYIIMLHGHANPTTFTEGEKTELTTLSNNRANGVRSVLMSEYNKLDGNRPANYENPNLTDRVSCSGYGGEKTLFGNNTSYTALNRRVEMILFEIVTTVTNG